MKKALSLLLALVMCLSVMAIPAMAVTPDKKAQTPYDLTVKELPKEDGHGRGHVEITFKINGLRTDYESETHICVEYKIDDGEWAYFLGAYPNEVFIENCLIAPNTYSAIWAEPEEKESDKWKGTETVYYRVYIWWVTGDGGRAQTPYSNIATTGLQGGASSTGDTGNTGNSTDDSKSGTAVGPGADQAGAAELKAGQSGTFTNVVDIAYYKINLAAASEVVMTLSMPGAAINEQAWVRTIYRSDRGNAAFPYVGLTGGPLAGRELAGDFLVGYHSTNGTFLSKQGTLYLDKGVYTIEIAHSLEDGSSATLKINSIKPVSNSGGWTKEKAPTIDPAKAIVKQTSCHRDWSPDQYYWKFTLAAETTLSIKKTVKLVPSSDDRINAASSLTLLHDEKNADYGNSILGKVDGNEEGNTEIREKDAVLTKTVTYKLSKGTYYVELTSLGYPGTEYTLEFFVQSGSQPQLNPIPEPKPLSGTYKINDPLGDVLYSDITAYINGQAIPTSIKAGVTMVVVEDLANYGFEVKWDGSKRTLSVERNKNKAFKPMNVTKDTANKPGAFKCKYVYTDIKTYLSGALVESFAINGVTLIDLELLALRYNGKVSWNGQTRELKILFD